jgi:hypothetical protein
VATENNDNNADRPTALIERDALLGLIDRSAEPQRTGPHIVPRERVRSRVARPSALQIVEMSSLSGPSRDSGASVEDADPRPRLLFAIIALLVFTFFVAIQLR